MLIINLNEFVLSKQQLVTLEVARKQAKLLKLKSITINKKKNEKRY